MASTTDRVLNDLQKVLGELETLIKESAGKAGEQFGGTAAELQSQFDKLRERLTDLQGEIEHGVRRAAKVADDSVRANPWGSVAIAAAGAFLLGLALARREPPQEP